MDLGTGFRRLVLGSIAISSLFVPGNAASAQVVTGTLGSPSATTTVKGDQLPAPPPPFGGVIKDNATDSTTWWPPRVVPPKGAPNILLILTDDQGFGVPGTFGGIIPTPGSWSPLTVVVALGEPKVPVTTCAAAVVRPREAAQR